MASAVRSQVETRISGRLSEVELYRGQMHDYQREGERFVQERDKCALFIDLGMGKTVIAATVACDRIERFEVEKVLIIAPLRVANRTWPDEFRRWDHLAPYRLEILTGPKRGKKLNSTAPVHVINRENVEWLVDKVGDSWPYGMVIIDESTSFKDHRTGRFKALRRVLAKINYLVSLTASPVAEGYIHLFAQIFLLDGGERLGRLTHYRTRYFNYNQWRHSYALRKGAKEAIEAKISDIVMIMKASDYQRLPPKTDLVDYCDLPEEVMALYRDLEKNFLVQVGDEQIDVIHASALSSKLRQLCSGFLYKTYDQFDPVTGQFSIQRDVVRIHQERIKELCRIAEESEGENLLIAYHFQESLEAIKKALPKAVVMDREGDCVTDWNNGKIKYLVAHPQSAGHGLNLQKGGRRIIFYDMPESLEYYEQFVGRLNRQGQTKPVFVHHLVNRGTKDEITLYALQNKQSVQSGFYQSLVRIQQNKSVKETSRDSLATSVA